MAYVTRYLPHVDDDSRVYWESARAHAVRMQKCDDCGKFRFYPSPACHFCGSLTFTWTPISGKGEIYTYSILERAKGNSFADLVPIAIVMVSLDEGPVMMADLVDYEPGSIHIGQRVEMTYEDVTDQITLPMFRPASAAG
jgi:uncharacterized protein